MKAPEITYRYIYPRDVAGPTFEVLSRTFFLSDAATSISQSLSLITKDKILVLNNISIQADPGATQALLDLRVSAFTPAGAEWNITRFRGAGTADLIEAFNQTGEWYILGREPDVVNVRVVGLFDAGVNANNVDVSLHGIVIPRGNSANF